MTSDLQLDELRVPPHSIEAEQSVLGALLRDNNAWDRISSRISSTDFYRYDHRHIFSAIIALIDANKPADVITVHDQLELAGRAEDCGGLRYLNAMAQNTPSSANIMRYADIVRHRGVIRQLLAAADQICEDAYNLRDDDIAGLLDRSESRILAIAEERSRGTEGPVPLQPLLNKVIEEIDALNSQDDPSDITGIPTGFTDVDKMTSGLQPGDLVIVAGRPSMGKSTFAVNIGEHVAVEAGLPVCVFSMEMAGTQLARKLLSSAGRLHQMTLRNGRLNEDDWPRLTHAIQKLHSAPLYIDETPALTPTELRSRARRLKRQLGNLGLIIVDYLQLMQVSGKGNGKAENRANEVSEISRSLKSLAKELKCPVIALSQLNRSLENRPNKRPIMADLRESGAIEQDADVIVFLYRDEVYNPDTQDKGTAEVIIGKQRMGPVGTVRLTWAGEHSRFSNYGMNSNVRNN
jgi:replicative DNA helicase